MTIQTNCPNYSPDWTESLGSEQLRAPLTQSGSIERAGLSGPLLTPGFGLAPCGELALLRSEVRTRLQFIVFAGIAIEVDDLLFGFADFRHMLSPIHVERERDKPFKVGIIVLPVVVRISPASHASVRTLHKGIEVILCACPSGVSLRCHWNEERAFDLALRRNRYLADLHRSVESAEVDVERHLICRDRSVVCDDNGSLESALWRAVRVSTSLNRDGENWRVRFEEEIAGQPELLFNLPRHALINLPRLPVCVSNDAREKNCYPVRHGVWTSGIALAARAFWTRDAEAPASSVASASSYSASENVRVLAIVEAELELIQVQRQIFLAHVVISAYDAALEQRPERIEILGMHFTAYVLASRMLDGIVRESEYVQIVVTLPFICRDQINFLAYGLTHEAIEGCGIGMLDHLADHVALSGDRANDRSLIAAEPALTAFLVPVAILVLAAHVSFVYFDDAHEFLKIGIVHSRSKPMAHIKGRAVGTGTDHPMDLKRADAFLRREHQVQDFEPYQQLVVRVLEDRPADDAKPIVLAVFAQPVKRPRVEFVDGGVAASRAFHAIRPAALSQVLLAGIFVRKERIKLRERDLANELRFMLSPRRVHEKRIAQMDTRVESRILAIVNIRGC